MNMNCNHCKSMFYGYLLLYPLMFIVPASDGEISAVQDTASGYIRYGAITFVNHMHDTHHPSLLIW